MYVASLDLCKAFDRVNHCGLLIALLKKGLSLCLINILFSWFSNCHALFVGTICILDCLILNQEFLRAQ